MEQLEVLEQVLAFLSERFPDAEKPFDASTRLSDSALISSIEVLEVVMFLEEQFNLDLVRSDLQYIQTPETITELILSKGSVA